MSDIDDLVTIVRKTRALRGKVCAILEQVEFLLGDIRGDVHELDVEALELLERIYGRDHDLTWPYGDGT